MITQQQLQHILTDTESYHVERTISTDNADKFCQAICAFSNDLSGSGKNGYLILGYVNRFSRGVYRVQKELKENGNDEATFDFSLITAFRVIEKVSEKYFEEGFGADTTQENNQKHPRNPQETTQEKILQAIKENPKITRNELANLIHLTADGIKYHLLNMTRDGLIKHIGSTKAGEWIILKPK